ncbi:kunitz-type elastase inhibitor BrEI-like [Arachis stenosperma]|uniref:kunitz-type elastase inhibitor BrEI-like n=1 Tax=Arachis stenosperma TaxID=217475 RepID=UPI0025ACBBA5|nr:kunitz-type elastase inhibitor BrEI-like [Arachis stenosperma]
MKVAMIQFLSLCIFLLINTQTLLAAEPEPVVDKQGEPLQPGVGYYVWPLWEDNGGLTLGHTRNKTCPLDVIRDPSFIGSPVTFRAPGLDYIPTETDLTIDFAVKTTCNEPTIWRLLKEGSGFWFLSTGGDSQSLVSKFKIERLAGDHAYEIYSFKFCPSQPGVICAPVGTFVDADGTKVMAIGDNIETYYVRFQKVFTYAQEKNPAFSIL